MTRLEAAFARVKSLGKRRVRLRFLDMTIYPASDSSKNAGSLYVKDYDFYLGKITDGHFWPSRDCDAFQAKYIRSIMDDPLKAAMTHGRETGRCSVCDRELIDARSVEMGIGPVCAHNWGF